MEYANQIQKLTERSVSGCASGCTYYIRHRVRSETLLASFYLLLIQYLKFWIKSLYS